MFNIRTLSRFSKFFCNFLFFSFYTERFGEAKYFSYIGRNIKINKNK